MAALFVAFWHLGRSTIVNDEFVYLRASWAYAHGDFSLNLEHPPTAKYLYGVAQLVLGQGPLGPRLVAALAMLGTGGVLFVWLRREVGFWTGLLAAGAWWLTPRGSGSTWADAGSVIGTRIDRFAMLEPLMMFFAVAALAAAWTWMRTGNRWWIAAAGALLAMSVTSKVSTAVLVLAIGALPLLFRRPRDLGVGALFGGVAFVVVFVLLYLPVGLFSAIGHMLKFQAQQNAHGHPTTILGTVYTEAPWWANFAFLLAGTGWFLLTVLVIGVIAALVVRPDRLVAYLGIALGVFLVFYVIVAKVSLPYYYDAWMPLVIALAAIGYARLATVRPPVGRIAAAVLVACLLVPTVRLGVAVAQTRPSGIALLSDALEVRGHDSAGILFSQFSANTWRIYFGDRGSMQPENGPFDAVVVGSDTRRTMPEQVRTFLDENRSELEHFRLDYLDVYVPWQGTIKDNNRDGTLRIAP
ncbi:glycosyltransferase family 39 protein [Curtobacterium sp. PhB115]|uniref:ArnT family glycosyltransferase n=1 Tax=Curtobacterium sp. PhB115 TaxID=2485173 RepID=UPI000F4C7166|nr:hypothetical protein [Curtobacterium sp. PhB115]ROP58559.1 hypothetical protein EDF19_3588 [Curtobacterium sp. PhB115]